jgi:hypothetical protein
LEYVVLSHGSFQKFLPVLEFLTKYSNTIPPGQKRIKGAENADADEGG